MQTNRLSGSSTSPIFGSKINAKNQPQTSIIHSQNSPGDRFELTSRKTAQPIAFSGHTPLHDAVSDNHEADMDYYLADMDGIEYLNAQDEKGNTPLHIAAREGHTQAAWNLLDYPGIDPSIENNDKKTPLDVAKEKKHPEIVKMLEGLIERTGLHLASSKNHVTELQELLVKGVSPAKLNSQDGEGNTALHLAAATGNIDPVWLLLGQPGIDPSIKNHDKETALQRAQKHNNTEIIPLLEAIRGCNALHLAAGKHQNAILSELLKNADITTINAKDDDGNTPLHIAAKCGNLQAVRMIGSNPGIDPSLENNEDETALEAAEATGHKEVVQLLNRFRGRNGIQIAAERNQAAILQTLLKDADFDTINDRDQDGNTALHLAAGSNNVDAARILLRKQGIDRDLKNERLETPLVLANKLKHTAMVKLLNSSRGIREIIPDLSAGHSQREQPPVL